MHYFRDSGVSSVLESSFTLVNCGSVRGASLALTEISLFLEAPLTNNRVMPLRNAECEKIARNKVYGAHLAQILAKPCTR